LAAASLMAAQAAFAAGGHHAVDDANILEPGQCEQEDWFSRERGGTRIFHAGLNCGVGAWTCSRSGRRTSGPATAAPASSRWPPGRQRRPGACT
jgi:hypothetical protein